MIPDCPRDLRSLYSEMRRDIMIIPCDALQHGWRCLIQAWQAGKGWMDGVRAAQPTSSVTSFLGSSSTPCGVSLEGAGATEEGLLPQGDLMCHFQEQSCLLNLVLYWACESRIFRSITKMFLYVGAAPNRVNQCRQFRIQHGSVKYLVSDDWSQEWDSVIYAGWGAFCG